MMSKIIYIKYFKKLVTVCIFNVISNETDKIKKILAGNGYPLELINRVIKSHDDNRRKPKLFGPE